jgi:hypothetical protein
MVVEAEAITPLVLMELAEQLLADYHVSGEHVDEPGVSSTTGEPVVRRKLIRPYDSVLINLARVAENAAEGMMGDGVESALSYGGFAVKELALPGVGHDFTLPKGITVYSYNPAIPKTGKAAGRKQTVKVSDLFGGYYNDSRETKDNPTGWFAGSLRWVGAGGYYNWINLDELFEYEYA